MPVCEWPTLTGSNSPPSKNLTARSCQGWVDNGSAQPWSASSLPEAQPTLKGLAGYRLVRTTINLQKTSSCSVIGGMRKNQARLPLRWPGGAANRERGLWARSAHKAMLQSRWRSLRRKAKWDSSADANVIFQWVSRVLRLGGIWWD